MWQRLLAKVFPVEMGLIAFVESFERQCQDIERRQIADSGNSINAHLAAQVLGDG